MIRRLVLVAAAIGGAILSMAFASAAALADKRVALIVGNSSYQTVPQLPNPSRDANAVAKMFSDAGFDTVDTQINVGNLEFKRAIRKFETIADQADIAVVYYAGHGLEIGGINYLIPVDARLASDRDAEDEAIPLERLVVIGRWRQASAADHSRCLPRQSLRQLDAPGTQGRQAARSVAGLGKVEPTSTDTLIAYAAKAGSTADDGDGLHSPFTTAVLKNLTVPGLDVRLAFGRVRDEVLKIDRQPAGAVRLWRARRRQYCAGAGAGGGAGNAGQATSRPTTNWFRRSERSGPGKCSWARTRPASMPISRAPRSRP